ncbi:MAG: glycosyltransferase family 39 protein [Elusimicrobiota bacterium]
MTISNKTEQMFGNTKPNKCSEIRFLCFLTFLLLFPFYNKAISSDAIFYIYTARQILKEPAKPFSFTINCADKNYSGWDVANNPPLISYFLAGVIKIFGENEKALHLAFLCFAILSVVGMYFLARKLKTDPLFSALLLIASPAFFVNATDIMLDVPLITFSVWGIYFCIREKYLGWLLLGFTILIKFVALINLGLLFVWFLLNKTLKKNIGFFIIPILFLVAWSLHNKFVYNELQILKKSVSIGISFGLVKEIPLLTYIGGAFVFPLSILWLGYQLKKSAVWLFLVVFATGTFFFDLLGYTKLQNFLFGLFSSSAILLFFVFIRSLKKWDYQKEIIFLVSWFFLYLFFFVAVSAIIAVRYLLPLLPPVILLFVKISDICLKHKIFLITTVIIGLILSFLIAQSDYILANSYRNISEYIKKGYADKSVYFTGHLGFQYYMERNGFYAVESDSKNYASGSLIVCPVLPVPQKIHPVIVKRLKLVEQKYILTKNPFKTMSPLAQAGFHLNMYGLLPYSFSRIPVEKFTIYEIR